MNDAHITHLDTHNNKEKRQCKGKQDLQIQEYPRLKHFSSDEIRHFDPCSMPPRSFLRVQMRGKQSDM